MDRATFETHLREAAERARDFARTLVLEALPDPIRFRVFLSRSHDRHADAPRERVYEADRERDAFECSLQELVDELYRDGRVPEWVNLQVSGEDERATFVTANCCGRFVEDDALLYHQREGGPPFHVLGPPLPIAHRDGVRYSVHHCATCVTPADVADLARVASRVRFLACHARAATSGVLASLPRLPQTKVVEVHGDTLDDTWLAALPGSVEHLRCSLRGSFALRADAIRPKLTSLSLSADALVVSGPLPQTLESLTISAGRLEGTLELPASMESLSLTIPGASCEALEGWSRPLRSLRSLSLQDTAVDATLAATLIDRLAPTHVHLSGTQLTADELAALARAHPRVKITPRRPA